MIACNIKMPSSLAFSDQSDKYHLQVNFIKICQTNKVLVTASRDGSFCIWDIVQVGKNIFGVQPRIPKVSTSNVQISNVR